MEKHPLYGKRKKKKIAVPNPLFVQWLTQWRDEAAEKGIKSQYTYGKALKTLKKCPLKFNNGKECKILDNFGDKICKMLDDKLTEHIQTYGTTEPVGLQSSDSEESIKPTKATSSTATGNKKMKSAGKEKSVSSAPNATARAHDISDSSGDEARPKQPARKRQKSGPRDYVPVYRSGPYALLIALYRDMRSEESIGYLKKEDLIRKAQPLADKSFTMPDPGCRYTAWSSMGTLIKKGLVIKDSSPARYSLTDSGCELSHKLESAKDDIDRSRDSPVPFIIHDPVPTNPVRAPAKPVTSQAPIIQQNFPPPLPDLDEDGPTSNFQLPLETSGLKYWFVSEDGQEVRIKDKAVVTVDDVLGVGFLVKCNYTQLLMSGFKYKLDTTRPLGDDYVYVYLSNENTADIANFPYDPSGVNVEEPAKFKARETTVAHSFSDSSEDEQELPPLISKPKGHADDFVKHKPSADDIVLIDSEESSMESLPCLTETENMNGFKHKQNGIESGALTSNSVASKTNLENVSLFDRLKAKVEVPKTFSVDSNDGCSQNSTVSNSSIESSLFSKIKLPRTTSMESHESCSKNYTSNINSVNSKFNFPRSLSENSQDSCSQHSMKSISSVGSESSSVQNLPSPDFVLRPGEFDIVLCVDNAEYYGASKGGSKTLLPDLIKNGIDCDLRKLHVGDILWVAKERVKPIPGQLERPPGRELVLNYIIERKRMDDLVGSCIDGRFKEQKFRLKKCGLHFPMYLIEEYGSMQHFSLPEATIRQTITNTQVIDGFKVKRTKDCKESVAFLTVFTRYLQSHFKDKTLYACGLDAIKENNVITTVNDSQQYLPTFEEFNQGSVKSKALTVKEMFGKQLIQVHGMSAEKARAVIDRYPTPSHLFEAYKNCSTAFSKETLLSSIKCGKAMRSLGQAQSKQIYQLYNTDAALN